MRALSVCFSTLNNPDYVFIAVLAYADCAAGIIAAIILALSPFQVRFAQEARMYAL